MLKRELLQDNDQIKHSEGFWKSSDGVNLFAQTWYPGLKPRAVINLIHGLGEHSSRFYQWAEKFASKGFVVRSFDLRGHGRSEGKRGHSSSYNQLMNDIELFMEQGRKEFSTLPGFIYGHSMGGNLVLNYSLQYPQTMKGLIITSPWLELTKKPSNFLLMMASFLSKILPGVLINNGIKVEDISRDLRVVHAYKNDPLIHYKISLRFFNQVYMAGLQAAISIYKINVPLLVMHGSSDNLTSVKASRNFVRNSSDKTTYIEWEGGYHELHNDLEAEEVFNSQVKWLNRII